MIKAVQAITSVGVDFPFHDYADQVGMWTIHISLTCMEWSSNNQTKVYCVEQIIKTYYILLKSKNCSKRLRGEYTKESEGVSVLKCCFPPKLQLPSFETRSLYFILFFLFNCIKHGKGWNVLVKRLLSRKDKVRETEDWTSLLGLADGKWNQNHTFA